MLSALIAEKSHMEKKRSKKSLDTGIWEMGDEFLNLGAGIAAQKGLTKRIDVTKKEFPIKKGAPFFLRSSEDKKIFMGNQ